MRPLALRKTLFLLLALAVPQLAVAEPLTQEQALALAAERNPSLKAALLDVAAAEHGVEAESRARVPVLVASVNGSYAETLAADRRTDSESLLGQAAVRFSTEQGTTIETGLESSVAWRNANAFGTAVAPVGPTTSASVYASVRQPLLRGAGEDAVLASLETAHESATQAELQRDLAASQVALTVLRAYWELWYAEQAVLVQSSALTLAQRQLADAQARDTTLGTGSARETLSFAASVASIEDALETARTTRNTRAIELGVALGLPPAQALELSAESEPPSSVQAHELPDAERVIEQAPELAGLRSQLRAADVRIGAADDADQARLDVFGKVTMGALWTEDTFAGAALPGGRPAFTALVGLELELPLGERSASAEAARARSQRAATEQRYQARVNALVGQASTLSVQLGAADRQVELSEESAKISAQLAEAERQLLALGTGSPNEVVRAEQSAREAQLRHLRAMVSRANSELDFEHTTGELLARYSSVFAEKAL